MKNNTCSKIFNVAQMKYMTFLYCLINILLLRMSMSVLTYHVSFWIYVRPWVCPKFQNIGKLGENLLFYSVIASYHVLCWFSTWFGYKLIKPFHVFGLLLYPPEDIRKPMVFRCFQGLQKQISRKEGVIWKSPYSSLSCRTKDKVTKFIE